MPILHRTHSTPTPGWGSPQAWGLPLDDDPLPHRATGPVGRWLWPTLAVTGFLVVVGFVLRHDHPAPGLSQQGLLTIALAALVVVLLTLRRAAGPGPLARALAEYAVVFVLAVLVAITGVDLSRPAASTDQASAGPDRRPALVRTVDGFGDWLNDWREWAREADRRTRPPSTTTPTSQQGRAMAPSPGLSSSTRRPR